MTKNDRILKYIIGDVLLEGQKIEKDRAKIRQLFFKGKNTTKTNIDSSRQLSWTFSGRRRSVSWGNP